jgi:serine/threonine protein kinase
MSAVRATFTGFDPYKLTGVRVTDRKLGRGSYATVLELEYMGLKCAGKKIHELLLEQGDASYTVRRFEEECRLLSQVRHPNIVQFLGVYFQQGVRAPILVMEFLPTNLTSCIEQYGILPKEISYSILHDVALGLRYLHSQTPAIIHRDLSSNNVLLTPNMTAKISDLGVARILNLTPLQVSRMTQTPGTPAYMPPEVMTANPKYDTGVDEFSYGVMIIHMFSGRWPEPQVGQICNEPDGSLTPVTEAKRREVFLQAIGNDHPLMDLILKNISNHPHVRAHASEIVERLAEMVSQFPTSFTNRLEMLRQIEADTLENRDLREEIERKMREIQELRTENEQLKSEVKIAGLNLHDFCPSQVSG